MWRPSVAPCQEERETGSPIECEVNPVFVCTTDAEWERTPSNLPGRHAAETVSKLFNLDDLISSVERALAHAPSQRMVARLGQATDGRVR